MGNIDCTAQYGYIGVSRDDCHDTCSMVVPPTDLRNKHEGTMPIAILRQLNVTDLIRVSLSSIMEIATGFAAELQIHRREPGDNSLSSDTLFDT